MNSPAATSRGLSQNSVRSGAICARSPIARTAIPSEHSAPARKELKGNDPTRRRYAVWIAVVARQKRMYRSTHCQPLAPRPLSASRASPRASPHPALPERAKSGGNGRR